MPIFLLGVDTEGIGNRGPAELGLAFRCVSEYHRYRMSGCCGVAASLCRAARALAERRETDTRQPSCYDLSLYPFGVSPHRCPG